MPGAVGNVHPLLQEWLAGATGEYYALEACGYSSQFL